jgi:hypothetical protein
MIYKILNNRFVTYYIERCGNVAKIYNLVNKKSASHHLEFDKTKYVLFKTIKFDEIYVGISKGCLCDHKPDEASEFRGNTVVFMNKNVCTCVEANSIFEFTLNKNEVVSKLYAPVGKNVSPYPSLVTNKNVYFLLVDDRTYVPIEFINKPYENAYKQYIDDTNDINKYKHKLKCKTLHANNKIYS